MVRDIDTVFLSAKYIVLTSSLWMSYIVLVYLYLCKAQLYQLRGKVKSKESYQKSKDAISTHFGSLVSCMKISDSISLTPSNQQ